MSSFNGFKVIGLGGMIFFLGSCQPQKMENSSKKVSSTEIVYDSLLASQYGADTYGMKQYVIAFLKTGENKDTNKVAKAEAFRLHMENIDRMAEEGDLVLAGPFMSESNLRGLYVFNVKTVEEAKALTETDPAVQQGYLTMELVPWYGSAGLMGLNDLHKTLGKPVTSKE